MQALYFWYRKSGLPRAKGAFRICSSGLAALKLWTPWPLQLRPGLLRFMDSPVQSKQSKPASLTCPRAWYSGNITLQLFKLTWTTSIGVDVPTQYSSCKVTPASSARACVSSPASLQGFQAFSCNMKYVKVLGDLCLTPSLAPQQRVWMLCLGSILLQIWVAAVGLESSEVLPVCSYRAAFSYSSFHLVL